MDNEVKELRKDMMQVKKVRDVIYRLAEMDPSCPRLDFRPKTCRNIIQVKAIEIRKIGWEPNREVPAKLGVV